MGKITKQQAADIQQAKTQLLEILHPGDTVYTRLDHVSRSGMMRHISVVIIRDNEINNITYLVARAMHESRADSGGIKQSGCGMDMGFNLVYNLGCALWPSGTAKPHGTRNGAPDTAGGYALKQRWM